MAQKQGSLAMYHGHSQSWPPSCPQLLHLCGRELVRHPATHTWWVSCSGAQQTTQEETSLCVPLLSPWKVFPWHVLSEVEKLTHDLVPGKESRSQGNRKQPKAQSRHSEQLAALQTCLLLNRALRSAQGHGVCQRRDWGHPCNKPVT